MRLVMAVSHDGFLARGPDDDMSWTTPTDKKLFRLLTQVDGVCGVGYASWRLMPDTLPGRLLVPITRHDCTVWSGDIPYCGMTFDRFAHIFPNGWLLGGPRLALEALSRDMLDQVFMCRVPVRINGGVPDDISAFLQASNGVEWTLAQSIVIDEIAVECWSRVCRRSVTERQPSGIGSRPTSTS